MLHKEKDPCIIHIQEISQSQQKEESKYCTIRKTSSYLSVSRTQDKWLKKIPYSARSDSILLFYYIMQRLVGVLRSSSLRSLSSSALKRQLKAEKKAKEKVEKQLQSTASTVSI